MKSQSIKSAFVPTVLLVAAVSLAACSPDIDITAPQFPIIAPEWQTFSIAGRFETDRRDLLGAIRRGMRARMALVAGLSRKMRRLRAGNPPRSARQRALLAALGVEVRR